jgi:hypothetical protein
MAWLRSLFAAIVCISLLGGAAAAVEAEPSPGGPADPAGPLGTGFTYQGQLTRNGGPITATCDFQFSLFDAVSGGTQIGSTQTVSGVSVAAGLFTVVLDFGNGVFTGSARWLAIAVRCPPDLVFTPLSSSRQPLTAAPYALALPGLRTEQNTTSPNVIGGSISNTVSVGVVGATIGGGGNTTDFNSISADYGTVGGGIGNKVNGTNVFCSGCWATIGGGALNQVSGADATVPGGLLNQATGFASFAAGGNARAVTDGSFVWSSWEQFAGPISSTVANEFLVRASGGITLYTDSGATMGAALYPGSSSWSAVSDRNLKANFAGVDGLQILNALAGIPIQTWNYQAQAASIRHMGPMGQDFHAAFGVGENDTTISTVDAQGVALAAIQGLYTLVQQKDAQIAALRDANTAQQSQLTAQLAALAAQQADQAQMNARLAALEARTAPAAQPAAGVALPWLLLAAVVLLNVGGLAGYALARARRH